MLAPRHIAVFGGDTAAEAIRQCRRVGFGGPIWPVHPTRSTIEGLPCYRTTADLPDAPDAAFVAVPREATVDVVADLAARGTGGVVCHASGFAEHGTDGAALQQSLVDAAADMALVGPNCIGTLNYLDGAALWPDQHGGRQVERGVAVITQSGNIGQNLTMQRRSLPLAQLITLGNGAVTGVADLVEAMLADSRITAIGLHLEGIDDVAGLSRVGLRALRAGVPVVVLKSGTSELGARANLSHTSSLAGSDVLCDALFRRLGMARAHNVETFVETLKFLHVHGALPGNRITSASCSGGEAALVADLAERHGLELPPLPARTETSLRQLLGDRVAVANPLDYHTYIWGDLPAQTACFTEVLDTGLDCHLLVVDFPRDDRCVDGPWTTTADALLAAHRAVSGTACVVSSLPEGLPEPVGERLLDAGIAPMQGIRDCLAAIAAAVHIGEAQRRAEALSPLPTPTTATEAHHQLDERTGKTELAVAGLTVPEGVLTAAHAAPDAAAGLGFPVVVKAVSTDLAHKSEVGGVRVGLTSREQVRDAVAEMAALTDEFLVEHMVQGAVAELLVGVRRDPRFGLALTLGAGGVLVELVRDTATLLLPATRGQIEEALRGLRIWPLLAGFRGPGADVPAVLDAITAVAEHARSDDRLVELDVNPLLALPNAAVAVDVLVRKTAASDEASTRRRTGTRIR
ncbi:acetate--CoA ligase family protein [Saccharopolyspora sp. TS4A08]|uniref:Acetate--CoA ligase family protein n=1 Tax=Saccharopolyspora ipomoeae TaxID=3042027 RepID=A0ABT6PR68_9PSEU|nr:acetate--CoA ligase family protein [Saccharopolyspora sp. TS4A08]MDI2030501.1 acetate--CoA ligase family protein [Saccharopolyspora sp. TS4A08]